MFERANKRLVVCIRFSKATSTSFYILIIYIIKIGSSSSSVGRVALTAAVKPIAGGSSPVADSAWSLFCTVHRGYSIFVW